MRRTDYKQHLYNKGRERKSRPAYSSKGFFYGLSVGLLATLVVHVYHISQPQGPADFSRQDTSLSDGQVQPQAEPATGEKTMTVRDNDLMNFLSNSNIVVPKADKQYILQAGNFRTEAEAQDLENRILSSGHKPVVSKINQDGEVWYGVQVGPFQLLADAVEVQNRLKRYRIQALVKLYQENNRQE